MSKNIIENNSYYEGLIQNLYSGANGCLLCFLQFFYQYNQCSVFDDGFCDCFEKLYEMELKNCKILSKILIQIGGDNKYYSSSRKYFSGYNVDYIKNSSKIFVADIELLEINIIEIKGMICKIENKEIKNDLKIILENKKLSLKILKEEYFRNNLI